MSKLSEDKSLLNGKFEILNEKLKNLKEEQIEITIKEIIKRTKYEEYKSQ